MSTRYPKIHSYTPTAPKIMVAKATNKCRACNGSIYKGEEYLLSIWVDNCKHLVGGKFIGFNLTKKYCKKCALELLNIQTEKPDNFSQKPLLQQKYQKNLMEFLGGGYSRYDIALKRTLIQIVKKRCHE